MGKNECPHGHGYVHLALCYTRSQRRLKTYSYTIIYWSTRDSTRTAPPHPRTHTQRRVNPPRAARCRAPGDGTCGSTQSTHREPVASSSRDGRDDGPRPHARAHTTRVRLKTYSYTIIHWGTRHYCAHVGHK